MTIFITEPARNYPSPTRAELINSITGLIRQANTIGVRFRPVGPMDEMSMSDLFAVRARLSDDLESHDTPTLAQMPIWSQLLCLKRQHADLKARDQHVAARAVKEQAIGLVEGWFEGQDEQWLDGAADLEQIAAARAQARAKLLEIDPICGF